MAEKFTPPVVSPPPDWLATVRPEDFKDQKGRMGFYLVIGDKDGMQQAGGGAWDVVTKIAGPALTDALKQNIPGLGDTAPQMTPDAAFKLTGANLPVNPKDGKMQAFDFSNPIVLLVQGYDQDEPGAATITPTWGGGKVVEERGSLIKDISISGTSGFMPFSKGANNPVTAFAVDVTNAVGDVISSAMNTAGTVGGLFGKDVTNPKYYQLGLKSGFYGFIKLRNMFRFYWHIKRTAPAKTANATRLIFFNEREDEFWEVIPTKFHLHRAAPRQAFMYEYNINLRTIGRSDVIPPKAPDETNVLDTVFGAVAGATDTLNKASSAIVTIANSFQSNLTQTIQTFAALCQAACNLGNIFLGNSPNLQVFSIADSLFPFNKDGPPQAFGIEGLDQVYSMPGSGGNQKQIDLETAMANAFAEMRRYFDNWTDGVNGMTPAQKAQAGMTDDASMALAAAMIAAMTAAWSIQARMKEMFGTDYTDEWTAEDAKFKDQATPDEPDVADPDQAAMDYQSGGASGMGINIPNAVATTSNKGLLGLDPSGERLQYKDLMSLTILRGENIFDLAYRSMGDVNNFFDLVLLNRLQWPYIVSDADVKPPRTLAWGEKILVPVSTPAVEATERGDTVLDSKYLIPSAPSDSGITTGGTFVSLADASKKWRVNEWVGFNMTITLGANVGETRVIVRNTATELFWDGLPALVGTIVAGEKYTVTLNELTFRPPMEAIVLRQLLGQDLAMTPDGDIRVGVDDVCVVDGLQNFIQWCTILTGTEPGSNYFHPSDGIAGVIGRKATQANLMLYKLFLRQSFSKDRRVESVTIGGIMVDSGQILGARLSVKLKSARIAYVTEVSL